MRLHHGGKQWRSASHTGTEKTGWRLQGTAPEQGLYGEGRGLRGGAGQEVQFPDTGENKAFVAQPESGGNAGMSRASSGQLPCQQPP